MRKKSGRRTRKKEKIFPALNVERRKLDVARLPWRLAIHAQQGEKFLPFLRKNLREARAFLDVPLTDLSVALVNDRQMSFLHERFLNIAGPTDVLTFPLDMNEEQEPTSGEIIICVPYARRVAKECGISLQNELLLYALHGMLHLAGFDDRTAAQYNRMHRTEDDILARLGVGPVFHRSVPRSSRARGAR